MKKLVFMFVAVAIISLASCGYNTNNLAVDNDTIPEELIDSIMNNLPEMVDSSLLKDSTNIAQ